MRIGLFLLAAQFPGQTHTEVLDRTVEAAVSVLSTHHPVALAEQAALLDQVGGGRFRLGVGRGGPWVDLEVFGTGLARYETGFAESLDLLLAALRDGRVAGEGTFAFREVPLVPRPLTGPPVVVACTSAGTAELAARRGLPMLLGMHAGDEEKRAMVAAYDRYGPPAPPGHIAAGVAYVADSRAEARRVLRTAMPRWLRPGLAGYVPVDGRPRRAPASAISYCSSRVPAIRS
jgi:alkanesulfonate monooxygenase SsuD/methylene tetrahydromethanopterin reductase-like flavin-dependent oxidoreductase (luciferase family)